MKQFFLLTAAVLAMAATSVAQSPTKMGPSSIIDGKYLGEVPSLAEQMADGTAKYYQPGPMKEVNPKRSDANRVVPGKGSTGPDPLWVAGMRDDHTAPVHTTRDPLLIFDVATPNATPTDPTGAVGPDHYVAAFNSSFRIFNKDGEALTGSISLGTIWPGNTSGDPIVMYDWEADRWFISQFFFNGFLVATSQGPDPLNDGWYTYEYSTNSFPDYPKYAIWSDGYYVTANKNSGSAGTTDVVYAMDRNTMLTGGSAPSMIGYPLPGIATSGFFSPLGFSVSGADLPPTGDMHITYLQDDAWGGVSNDHLKIWTIQTDWDTPANSTIELSQEVETEDFDSVFDGGGFSNIPQPSGPDIDALQATIMYMASYRRFASHNSVLINFTVDLDGSDDLSGVRWMELRQDGDGDEWTIYQEGTYAQPDGHSAFCASMCMDSSGNIGMGYTVCSAEQAPSLRYTGRYASDPLGEMTLEEAVFADGGGTNPSFRYGDYAQMTLDPDDEKTFWYVGEHFGTNSNRTNTVGTFQLAPVHDLDVGVVDIVAPIDGVLSDAESVTITVRNYGLLDASNIPVFFQVDGGDMVTGTVPGPIASQENAAYTFPTTADFGTMNQTYSIWAGTELEGDQDENNDDHTEEVTHLLADDVGVVSIDAPNSAEDMALETVSVTIENFGGNAQSGFEVQYTIDGGTPVVETFTGTVGPQTTATFNFATQGDFTEFADFDVAAQTNLDGDQLPENDGASTVITHNFCQPGGDCSYGDGFQTFELEEIDNASGCDEGGYGDYTSLSTGLTQGGTYTLSMTTGYGDQFVTVWIDYNDNIVFEDDEKIIDGFVVGEGEGGGEFEATIPFTVPADAPLGEHLMRAKTNWQGAVEGACDEVQYGETEDYIVDLLSLGVTENLLGAADLVVATLENNHFQVSFQTTATSENLTFQLFDTTGRILMQNRVPKSGDRYVFDFDMSCAAAGAYLIRLGNDQAGKVTRIAVR